jgi:hypothetical protein
MKIAIASARLGFNLVLLQTVQVYRRRGSPVRTNMTSDAFTQGLKQPTTDPESLGA